MAPMSYMCTPFTQQKAGRFQAVSPRFRFSTPGEAELGVFSEELGPPTRFTDGMEEAGGEVALQRGTPHGRVTRAPPFGQRKILGGTRASPLGLRTTSGKARFDTPRAHS